MRPTLKEKFLWGQSLAANLSSDVGRAFSPKSSQGESSFIYSRGEDKNGVRQTSARLTGCDYCIERGASYHYWIENGAR
jgi:hypothetical protein